MERLMLTADARAACCVVLLLLPSFEALTAGEPAAEDRLTPRQEYEALVDAFEQGSRQLREAIRAAGSDEKKRAVVDTLLQRYDPIAFNGRFLELVQRHPSDPAALDAFAWIIRGTRGGSEAREAAESLSDELLGSEHTARFCRRLVDKPCPVTRQLLERIMRINPQREVQGYARYGVAQCYKRLTEMGNKTPQQRAQDTAKAAGLLSQVVQFYGDLELKSGTLGTRAAAELFELRHLAIGQTAPEIEGKDLDGCPLKLSDYRGKVVLLVFSRLSTCSPCRQCVPQHKELVQKSAISADTLGVVGATR
jgi:hypothetical protein